MLPGDARVTIDIPPPDSDRAGVIVFGRLDEGGEVGPTREFTLTVLEECEVNLLLTRILRERR